MDGHSATAVFAAKGVDVTPNKDKGLIKVFSLHVCVGICTSNILSLSLTMMFVRGLFFLLLTPS